MTKTQIGIGVILLLLIIISLFLWKEYCTQVSGSPQIVSAPNVVVTDVEEDGVWPAGVAVTERYRARVDRVDVVFEHREYTRYRLQTNGLVRTGELNTERGFGDDPDATVYVLNWQKPEGEQIYYVRLTTDPTHLFVLDSERKIIRGSALTLE